MKLIIPQILSGYLFRKDKLNCKKICHFISKMSKSTFFVPHCRFTRQEDEQLINIVNKLGPHSWQQIANSLGNIKTARQYRERYLNYLSPSISKEPWSHEEDMLLLNLYSMYGPKWSFISQFMPGRSAPRIKNHYVTISKHFSKFPSEIFFQEKKPLPLPQINSTNQNELISPLGRNNVYSQHKNLLPSVDTFLHNSNSTNFYSIASLLN